MQTKNQFKTPEGLYKVDLQITKHAVNKGARPQYMASRCRLLSTKIDLIDNSQSNTNSSSDSDTASSGSQDKLTTRLDPCGVFLSFNTNDNKVYSYNLMNMMNEKDCGEPIDRLSCDVLPTCHKIHASELSRKKLDLLIGFSSGDVVIHSALTKANLMFNKQLAIDKTSVKSVAWSPLSRDMFVVAHASGNAYVYNSKFTEQQPLSLSENMQSKAGEYYCLQAKSSNSNPVTQYHFSASAINDMRFSPNGSYLAVVSSDGYLRVIDYLTSQLVVVFKSYYGALTCCCWSPDGRYIVTGGEDDMISVFDFTSRCLLARGIGHSSYISSVIFDPVECNNEQYRFLSVGDDCKLILWNIDKVENDAYLANIEQSEKPLPVIVPSQPMSDIPTFEPVRIHRAHHEPIRDLAVFEMGIVTVCNRNIIKFWVRPKAVEEAEEGDDAEDVHAHHPDHFIEDIN